MNKLKYNHYISNFVTNPTERDKSEYHQAFSYLGRLNVWFYMAAQAKLNQNMGGWFGALEVIFTELSTSMNKKDELDTQLKRLKKLKHQINQFLILSKNKSKVPIPEPLYWEMYDFEIYLRQVMSEAGLLLKIERDPAKL
jgi:hypothetical protein